ncbi:MAG TPA: hemerythrin domain-containing protein [Allosphingosinicella sp.]
MKSISAQDPYQLGGRGSVLARQKRDHVDLDRLLRRLEEVPAEEVDAALLKIYRLVFRHAFAEEAVLWPVVRRLLPDGEALTLRVELEHQQVNALVTELERLEPGSPAHRRSLERLVELLREDVRDEEDALLPRLQEKLSPAKLRLLGAAWEVVRAIAPTRAHPIVSRRPPGNVLAAAPLALLDRLRDLLDARLQQGANGGMPGLRKLSFALQDVSHAVERLPGMMLGESSATRAKGSNGTPWTMTTLCLAGGLGLAALALASRSSRRKTGTAYNLHD